MKRFLKSFIKTLIHTVEYEKVGETEGKDVKGILRIYKEKKVGEVILFKKFVLKSKKVISVKYLYLWKPYKSAFISNKTVWLELYDDFDDFDRNWMNISIKKVITDEIMLSNLEDETYNSHFFDLPF